jgi:hypothetical protein
MADDFDSANPDLNPTQVYYNWAIALPPQPNITINTEGDLTVVTTINGNSGQVTGPTISLSGGATGYVFNAAMGTISLAVSNAATVRASIEAAKSGVNTDITELNGASQVDVSSHYAVAGTQVVTSQQAAIPDAVGGTVVDTEARTALNALLAALRIHGLIDT